MEKRSRTRLSDAVDRLAGMYEYGHLMSCVSADELLNRACDELEAAREALKAADAIVESEHRYNGDCPDELQPGAFDGDCPRCVAELAYRNARAKMKGN